MKFSKAIMCVGTTALIIASTNVLADPPGQEARETWKGQMKYEREQAKRDREWEREQRKRYEELGREERKRQKEMAREERKRLEERERETDYVFEQYGADDSSEPEYLEDKMYRVVKILRDLKDVVVQ